MGTLFVLIQVQYASRLFVLNVWAILAAPNRCFISIFQKLEGEYYMVANIRITEEVKQALRKSDPEIESKRLDLLRGRRILMVMGSYPGKRHMYLHARELGIKMVVLDGPGHWARTGVEEGLFEQFIEVDLYPTKTLADRALEATNTAGLHFDALATFEDFAGPLTARLARNLGLKGHPLPAILASRNKITANQTLRRAGLSTPRFFHIQSAEDLEQAAALVGFPAVLKPISGASQVATYRVNNEEQLRSRYAQVMSEIDGHLKTRMVHSDNETELTWANGVDMTLEEFLDGEEFDVDMLLSEGGNVYASVTRDLPNPYLKSGGSQMPPDFPPDKQHEMVLFAGRVLHVLGFMDGAFHVEVKYTSCGPRLIEVNARIGGGPLYELHRWVWGVDLVEQYLMTCLGIPIRPQKAPQPATHMVTSDLICPYSGVIMDADFLSAFTSLPQVVRCKTFFKAGQAVTGPDRGVPDSLGEIMVYGPSVGAASRTLNELLNQVQFPISNLQTVFQPEFQAAAK